MAALRVAACFIGLSGVVGFSSMPELGARSGTDCPPTAKKPNQPRCEMNAKATEFQCGDTPPEQCDTACGKHYEGDFCYKKKKMVNACADAAKSCRPTDDPERPDGDPIGDPMSLSCQTHARNIERGQCPELVLDDSYPVQASASVHPCENAQKESENDLTFKQGWCGQKETLAECEISFMTMDVADTAAADGRIDYSGETMYSFCFWDPEDRGGKCKLDRPAYPFVRTIGYLCDAPIASCPTTELPRGEMCGTSRNADGETGRLQSKDTCEQFYGTIEYGGSNTKVSYPCRWMGDSGTCSSDNVGASCLCKPDSAANAEDATGNAKQFTKYTGDYANWQKDCEHPKMQCKTTSGVLSNDCAPESYS